MPLEVEPYNEVATQTATIAAAAFLSDAVMLPPGHYLAAVIMPDAWTAADITFQASADGAAYADLYDDAGNEVTLTVDVDRYVALETPNDFHAAPYIKLRSGTGSVAVAQAAARELTLVSRPI